MYFWTEVAQAELQAIALFLGWFHPLSDTLSEGVVPLSL
jgi:hypothetical protein